MDTNSKKQQEIIEALRSENECLKREVDDLKSEVKLLQQGEYPREASVCFEDYTRIVGDRNWRCQDCECGVDVEEGQVPHVFYVDSCHDCYQSRIDGHNVHYDGEDVYRYYSEDV